MPLKSWYSASKILLLAGVAAIAASAGFVKVAGGATTDYYPGPCATAPSNISITYAGTASNCASGGSACQAGEAVRFTASATNYAFASCDRFVWTFGDDGTTQTTYSPSIIHTFAGPGPRTVNLRVENQFGSATASAVTLADPVAVKCTSSSTVLCLGKNVTGATLPAGSDGRFRITLAAKDNPVRTSKSGTGQPIPQNDLFGYFSIPALTNNPSNPEVFVKLLDGRSITGSFWLFWGSLTDFDYTITAFDTVTGQQETYNRPAGASYGGFDTSMFKATSYTQAPEACPVAPAVTTVAPSACTAGTNTLCLSGGRFKVTIQETHTGGPGGAGSGPGQALPQGDLFGYFSFPVATQNPSNPEVFIKILDGRAINGKFWVFYGGLTSLQYNLTVTDTTTGKTNTYSKGVNSACGGSDTSAF